ncbi:uncharacterized protein BYT42DRAFT_563753 [Radiomyces spectabilis]|uniref:uncharacterized protein n=1 Tax=Radiomyces spectabilis TaxID=64574 RepID=UPI0022201C79|nr:uncharacterized protein BYT42DRAFT_563753 [Radiomyces spectabilis]KAI8384823.1 hypothetical protein BYT42DRAFT_563753 [Radiomyces spectabilis]
MFLDWIAQLQLLQHDSQTNILGSLPLSIRRTLISEITSYLHPAQGKQAPDPSIFASPAHVKWFMEVIGQGFNLPLEDMHITTDDVNIYAQWLFEPNKRPAAVVKDGLEQEFYQIIFHQYSLLFQPRIARSHHHATPPAKPSAHANPGNRPTSFHINVTPPVNVHNNVVPVTLLPMNNGSSTSPSLQNNASNLLKETLSHLVLRHIELCKKTLNVFATAGRTLDMTPETWTVLLKIMLGIADVLLKEPMGDTPMPGVLNMGDELCDHLLRVLFELWLRSTNMDVEMWDILKSCFMRWTHRPKAIKQWSSTSLSLTNRITHLLYGTQHGTDVSALTVNGVNVKIDLPNEFVYYAWHRMLYLIPHPLQLSSANFTLAMLGIGQLVDTLNAVNDRSSVQIIEGPFPSNGNTILHMFAPILFDACSIAAQADLESQRGCAEAFGILCRIFRQPQTDQPFLRTYTERFYAALCVGLKSDACLPTILVNCTELFAADLEGIRMLVPDFISAIKMILPKLQIECQNVPVDELRLAAIKVISTIMCFPNHFEKVQLKPGWDWDLQCTPDSASVVGEQEQLVTQLIRVLYEEHSQEDAERPFTSLKFYILELLLMSLRTESSSYNMRFLLHLINVYVIEDVPFCPGLVGTVVKLIQEKILTMQLPSDVTLVAFDVLMDFVDLYDYVKRDSKNVARELVLALCRYVDTLIGAGKLNQTYPLIVQAYDCMIKWILVSHWIIDDRDCYQAVIATLSKGITIFDRDYETPVIGHHESNPEKKKRRDTTFPPTKQLFQLPPRSNKAAATPTTAAHTGQRNGPHTHKKEEIAVRMAAEYCMSQFVNQLGKFPLEKEHGSANRRSSSLDDLQYIKYRCAQQQADNDDNGIIIDVMEEQWQLHDCVRYFLIDNRIILALVDAKPKAVADEHINTVPAMTVILRDTTGKYIWTMETQYKDRRLLSAYSTPMSSSPAPVDASADVGYKLRQLPTETDRLVNPVTISTAIAVNEAELPSIETMFECNSTAWKQWHMVKSLAERQKAAERQSMTRQSDTPLRDCHVNPPNPKIDLENARGFRLLLSQLGLLKPQNRKYVTPLRITDVVISEMETLDLLNERDCISISAYYAASGNISWSELIEKPPVLKKQFLQFLNCLGWPINMGKHRGFKGKLDRAICHTTPYYCDRTIEFLVNVPYFLNEPPADDVTWGTTKTISKIHQQVTSDDHVCVIWIEDLMGYEQLAKRIKTHSLSTSKAMVFIFVNPLKNSGNGLYWVRILIPTAGNNAVSTMASHRLSENALIFGPLVDGMIVSRHALGTMIRNTSISAHQACRVVTDTYTRPYVIRKQFIEEMAHRHRMKLPLSEFYTELFTDKDQ